MHFTLTPASEHTCTCSLELASGRLIGEILQVARSVRSSPRLTNTHHESPGPCLIHLHHAASVPGCIVSLTWAGTMLGFVPLSANCKEER